MALLSVAEGLWAGVFRVKAEVKEGTACLQTCKRHKNSELSLVTEASVTLVLFGHQCFDCTPEFFLSVVRKPSFKRFVLANFVSLWPTCSTETV